MSTITIYLLLLIITALYAWVLSIFQRYTEPDLTWLEVVIGVTFCLCAAYYDRLANGPYSDEAYEGRVWLAFLIGSVPIIAWSIGKSIGAWARIFTRIWRRNGTAGAEALADQRGSRPQDDD